MNQPPDPVIDIFSEALAMTPEDRELYLEGACETTEAGVLLNVESLLKAYADAGGFLDEPVAVIRGASLRPVGEMPGDRVGKYRLVEQIGEGGCGVVFLAEQEEPVRRQVALKVVKPGMDTRSVIAQFESERQALAMMDHPNIARVYDAGATDAGRPYFVMELVRGVRITDYCDQHRLTIQARLELFVQVCHAIQHAHQKGIIHRDIKPSNILVTSTEEGAAFPKVIDFGIAKATTGQRLTDKTLYTSFEMLIGTPAYMSPEQAALTGTDLDTRTDIYSLGVLLYELLTWETPFEIRELFKHGVDEVRQGILNRQALRPSMRLKGMSGEMLERVAESRQFEPVRLIRAVRGDLDWIVMKALEKDRARRYPTANALAVDVQHYLANEPVLARSPSALYQMGKLLARNRLLVGSMSAILVLLVAGLVATSMLLAKERAAHERAEIEKHIAAVEAAKSKQVSAFLSKMLSSVSPSVAKGRDTTLMRELLAKTDEEISVELKDQPEVEISLRVALGSSYGELGDNAAAERMFRRAFELCRLVLPAAHHDTATAMNYLAAVLIREGSFADAEPLLVSAQEIWRQLGAENDMGNTVTMENLAVLRSRQNRGEEAETLMRRVYAWRERNLPADDASRINSLANLAVIASGSGKYAEAEEMFREVLKTETRVYGEDHPKLAGTLLNLSRVLFSEGRKEEQKDCLARAVAIYRTQFNAENSLRTEATFHLANIYREAGQLAEAEPLYREILENSGLAAGQYSQEIDISIGCLVVILSEQKRAAEAEALLNGILTPQFCKTPHYESVMQMRLEFRARTGRWREAAADARSLIATNPENADYYDMLAALLVADGDVTGHRALCGEMLSRFGSLTGNFAGHLAKDCLLYPNAVEDLAAVNRLADASLDSDADEVWIPLFRVGKALAEFRQGNFATAENLASQVEEAPPQVEAAAMAVRAMAFQKMDRPEDARRLLSQGATVFEMRLPALRSGYLGSHWRSWVFARQMLKEARMQMAE